MRTETYIILMIQYVTLCPHSQYPRVVQSTTCPVRDLTSPRDVQSASWQSASWRIHELSSNQNTHSLATSQCMLIYAHRTRSNFQETDHYLGTAGQ